MVIDRSEALNFIRFALSVEALKFGNFKTKSDRLSPYFFNIGIFNSGDSINKLAQFYSSVIMKSGIEFDMLFGPAYKGIPLVVSISMALANNNSNFIYRNTNFAFNRKESKDHGEKGLLIGAPLRGKVIIVDDVITSGISVHESFKIISDEGAEPVAIVIALDRMERSSGNISDFNNSAVADISDKYKIPVISIASLNDILSLVQDDKNFVEYAEKVKEYRSLYGT